MNKTRSFIIKVTETSQNTKTSKFGRREKLNRYTKGTKQNTELMEGREVNRKLYDLTSLPECLAIAIHEYDIERDKNQSFHNRAGIIITIFAAIGIAIYDKVPILEILNRMSEPLTFMALLQIITGILIYAGLTVSLVFAIQIISVQYSDNFDTSIFNEEFISSAKIYSVSRLLEIYLDLVNRHRLKNNQTAKRLAYSQWSLIISIILIVIYLMIK